MNSLFYVKFFLFSIFTEKPIKEEAFLNLNKLFQIAVTIIILIICY